VPETEDIQSEICYDNKKPKTVQDS